MSVPKYIRGAGLLAIGTVWLHASPGANAQQVPGQADDPTENAAGAAREHNEFVFVRDSAGAQDKFKLAQKMERLKEWDKSADLYQEVLEKYRDRVIPDGTDRNNVINRYTSVTWGVLRQLSQWPPEGLNVYRGRYEPKAAALVAGAQDENLSPLYEAWRKYFVTESGKKAGIRLIDANLERGEYAAAAEIGDQLLTLYPAAHLTAERPAVLFRTALAYRLSGDGENIARSEERAKTLAAQFPKEMGVVRGKDAVLADILKQEFAAIDGGARRSTATAATTDAWPTFGGGPSRAVVSTAKAAAGTRLYSVPFAAPDLSGVANVQSRQELERNYDTASRGGATLSVMPVVDRGELFFQDGARIYAVSLETGVPLTPWLETYPNPATRGQYLFPGMVGSGRATQQTLTVTDRFVLAVMGQPDLNLMKIGVAAPADPKLVCLDRHNGKQAWAVSLATATDIPKDEDEKVVRTLTMSGAPLVVGDTVLTIARSAGGQQGEDCYVLAFDLTRGAFRWSCYVASSGLPANTMYAAPMQNDRTSHLAYANGRVFVQTNLGAVAALDAYSGTIVWLNIYPMDVPQLNPRAGNIPFIGGNARSSAQRPKVWQYNPIMLADGKAFVLPDEGRNLLIYDAVSGQEVNRLALDDIAVWDGGNPLTARPKTIVGIDGERIVLASEDKLLCLNWKTYREEEFEKFAGADNPFVYWPNRFPERIAGRPFMSESSVYATGNDCLRRIDTRTGNARDTYPAFPRKWEDGEGPGNIVVSGDYVVVAGVDRVNVYTDLGLATAKLDKEVAATPTSPEPRLRYAEVMFVAGKPDEAIRRLDEAVELLGGADNLAKGRDRNRLFNDAVTFATKTADDIQQSRSTDAAVQRINAFFDRAAKAVADPQQFVQYRLARGKFAESQKQLDVSLKLYQEVLASREARAVPLLDDETNAPKQAGDVAENAVAALIKTAGPTLYEAYETQARESLAEAAEEADAAAKPSRLLDVAESFPNASVAADAMMAAAEAFESATRPREAVRVLRQMWFKYGTGSARVAIAEGMARNYLATDVRNRADTASAAAARLQTVVALSGEAKLTRDLKGPDGAVIAPAGTSMEQALNLVRKIGTNEADKVLADFHLPIPQAGQKYPKAFLPQTDQMTLPGATALVLPARDFGRRDRLVTWSPTKLAIWSAGVGVPTEPLCTSTEFAKDAKQSPRGVAWVDDIAVVWGDTRAVAIDTKSGKTNWSIDLETLPPLEVVRGSATTIAVAPQQPDEVFINGNRIVLQPGMAGNARNFVVRGGQIVAQPAQPVPVLEVPPDPDAMIAPAIPPSPPANSVTEQVADVRIVGDRVLLSSSMGRLLAADLTDGRTAWQTRLAETTPDRVEATEEFTVVRVSDQYTVQLHVLDTYSGRVIGNKAFATINGSVPVNLALSPDGSLVYTLPDRLCLRDLYKPWDEEERVIPAGPPDQRTQPIFSGANQPGQLVISEGRILALADNVSLQGVQPNEKIVRVHSLETGLPLPLKYKADGAERVIDRVLTSGTKDWNVFLRTVGPRLYVISPRSIFGYNLDRPEESWKGVTEISESVMTPVNINFRDAFIGTSHLVVLDQRFAPANNGVPNAAANGGNPSPHYRLHAFARYPGEQTGMESGKIDYSVEVKETAGVAPQWQACDGGFFYATRDGKVRALPGSRVGE